MPQTEERAVAFAHEASLGLPGSIKQVADFLLSEGTGVEQLTMGQIAARAYTSKPTLVRFAKQAGYDGWKAYRRDFLVAMRGIEEQRAEQAAVDVNYPFDAGASTSTVTESLVRIHKLAAQETQRALDLTALEHAADAIIDARNVAFLGVMQNLQRGKIFASNLGLIGILCHTPHIDESAAVAAHLSEGDCIIVASYSGGLESMPMAFVPRLKARGVTVVAITNSERSPLGDIAHHTLGFAPLEHHHAKVAAFYSGACTSLILDELYATCYARRFDESRGSREAILKGLHGYIPESLDAKA